MSEQSLHDCIVALARSASVEMNVQDVPHLDESRALLSTGKKIYVSHLPRQEWPATIEACRAVRRAGFEPVPHIPVRLLHDEATLDRLLGALSEQARVSEALLISGDYARARGPYSTVLDALRAGVLHKHGLKSVSLAGHPEGHPATPLEQIRCAEIDKVRYAQSVGLDATLVTQFFLEPAPFLDWARELQGRGARLIAGIAGPASLMTLIRFAVRCGLGRSFRALGARPGALGQLVGEYGPESIVSDLARALQARDPQFSGLHVFCFGGFLLTCAWLQRVAEGQFDFDDHGSLRLRAAKRALP
jgi:methylenetetrahydrofolate reductase (NADPH)